MLPVVPFFAPPAVARFIAAEPPAGELTARSGYFALLITLTSLCVLQEHYGL